MIKLIATDMDGTFLTDNKEISPEFDKIFNKLKEKGILFCVASGRQYNSLKRLFAGKEDDMIFISDNGAVITYKGKTIHATDMEKELSHEIIDFLRTLNGKEYLYDTDVDEYIENASQKVLSEAKKYLIDLKVVDDLKSVSKAPVKISVYSEAGYDKHIEALHDKFGEKAHVCTSGFEWTDILKAGVNKGVAIKMIQDMFDIDFNETMIFGDEMNDFEMMTSGYFSYCMENAADEIKQISRFNAGYNNEFGVIETIKENVFE